MALTQEQTKQLLDAAKQRGLTREQAADVLTKANEASSIQTKSPGILEQLTQGDAIPNTTQAVAGIVGIPFGKPGRVAAGTVGRSFGEAMKQNLAGLMSGQGAIPNLGPWMKQQSGQTLTPQEQQQVQANTQQAKQNLIDMGGETAVGAITEGVGEYVLGPALSAGGKVVTKTANVADDVLSVIPGVNLTKNLIKSTAKSGQRAVQERYEILANTLLKLTPTQRELLEDRGMNLGKEFIDDAGRFSGATTREIRESVINEKNAVGKKLLPELAKVEDNVPVKELGQKAQREYQKLLKTDPELAKQYWQEMQPFLKDHANGMSAVDAFNWKKQADQTLYLASGQETRSTITSGQVKAKKEIADYLRGELRKNNNIADILDDYEKLSWYDNALAGSPVEQVPKGLFGNVGQPGLIDQLLLGRFRSPNFILPTLQQAQQGSSTTLPKPQRAQMEALMRTLQQPAEAVISGQLRQ